MYPLSITTYKPTEISHVVERMWIAETNRSDFNLLMLSTHFINVLFPLDANGITIDGNTYHKPIIKGTILKPFIMKIPAHSKVFAIRLYAYGLYPFRDAFNMVNGKAVASETLENFFEEHKSIFFSQEAKDIESLITTTLQDCYVPELEKKIALFKNYYLQLLEEPCCTDLISCFCRDNDVNYINLNRICNKVIGITPKKLERLIKYRKAVDFMLKTDMNFTDIALNAGYFDQPHFVKEFKHFTNSTPSEFIKFLKEEQVYTTKEVTDFSTF